MLRTSGRVSFCLLELYSAEAGACGVAGLLLLLLLHRTANTCGAFHGSGPSNFDGKSHIFHGHISARERSKGGLGVSNTGGG